MPPETPRRAGEAPATRLVGLGRDPAAHERAVNPPVQRGSTLLFDSAGDLYGAGPLDAMKGYGLEGLSTQDRLAGALTEWMGGAGAVLAPSGLAAITLALMAAVKAGDHLLVTDSAYGPTRRFCQEVLSGWGVETTFYDPRAGADIAGLIRPRTRLIVLESPGSLTFEIQDVPAICAAARARGVATLIDDTWSAGLWMRPFDLGVDLSMQALTKYQAGHADVLAGAVIARDPSWVRRLKIMHQMLGMGVSAEDCWLTLRGMRTMALRMRHQDDSARRIAAWLESRPEVARVLHPALPSHPDHALWARDFTGAGGLFAIVLRPYSEAQVHAFCEACRVFGMGFSWGGFESLILPLNPQVKRACPGGAPSGPLIRLAIGLEDGADLIADLEAAFARLS